MLTSPAGWFSSPGLGAGLLGIAALWCGAEVWNCVRPRRGDPDLDADRGSHLAILIAFYAAVAAALLARSMRWGVVPAPVSAAGLLLMLGGIALREWAVLTLGSAWSLRVQARLNQELVIRGPYRYIRHPAYTGTILTLAGFGLALGTGAGAGLAALIVLAAFLHRARREERLLLLVFGDAYQRYLQRTWRFMPGW